MLQPDETYEKHLMTRKAWFLSSLKLLEAYDHFLASHRIRPDFFCKYALSQARPFLPKNAILAFRYREKELLRQNLHAYITALHKQTVSEGNLRPMIGTESRESYSKPRRNSSIFQLRSVSLHGASVAREWAPNGLTLTGVVHYPYLPHTGTQEANSE
ncbi:hypothetical protein HUJ05_002247 [Dendroctonus ponderosae]|nr:hypothetical protein HUJ05_002247 [Dendroctonus ponderosae]